MAPALAIPAPGVTVRYYAISRRKTFSEGFRLTTNNRMEMMAAIVALEALTVPCAVTLSTDSQYVRQWHHQLDP